MLSSRRSLPSSFPPSLGCTSNSCRHPPIVPQIAKPPHFIRHIFWRRLYPHAVFCTLALVKMAQRLKSSPPSPSFKYINFVFVLLPFVTPPIVTQFPVPPYVKTRLMVSPLPLGHSLYFGPCNSSRIERALLPPPPGCAAITCGHLAYLPG